MHYNKTYMSDHLKYACDRCGHQFRQKCHYENHLKRLRPCKQKTINGTSTGFQNIKQISSKDQAHFQNIKQISSKSQALPEVLGASKNDHDAPSDNVRVLVKSGYVLRTCKSTGVRRYHCSSCDCNCATWQGIRDHISRRHESTALVVETTQPIVGEPAKTVINGDVNNGIINQGNMQVNNNTQNIIINGLGKENISYLTESADFKRFMTNCIKNDIVGVCQLLVKKHFDKEHPENHNIRKLNKKDEFIEYHDGKEWQLGLYDNVLEDMFKLLERHFAEFVDRFACQSQVLRKQWLDNFMRKVGEPLEWDLTGFDYDYEFNENMSEEEKERLKNRIFRLACEYVYRHSRQMKPI